MKKETAEIRSAIAALSFEKPVTIMEVCGTHTMAIAKNGIKSMLPEAVTLLSGPGCPVCVTPSGVLDRILELAMRPDVVIATYGDMVRVPGSMPGDSLARRRALGARVEVVYSPLDAVELAEREPGRKVVFLGAGFETSAPGTAAAVLAAEERKAGNFYVLSMLKSVEPALRALIGTEGFSVQGFLCPGHVATITGAEGFRFLPEEYRLPAVVGGFEPEEILTALYHLLKQISDGKPALENAYPRAVRREGNVLAQRAITQCFALRDDEWRGLGIIPESGMKLRGQYEAFDAGKQFPEVFENRQTDGGDPAGCRCGDVICGRLKSEQCPLFGKRCTPEDPVGPCMVSSEGACAAAYKYGGLNSE